MGASRTAGAGLVGFLGEVRNNGAESTLRALDLGALIGRSVEDIFLGLVDFVCPEGSTVDDGIARSAFIEMIAELDTVGIESLDDMTVDQMQTVLELYATNAIKARICNDIGMKAVCLPSNVAEAKYVEEQLTDFIRGGVADALTEARNDLESLTPARALEYVDRVYESAFTFLQVMGDREE